MLRLYYKIWVDALVLERSKTNRPASWHSLTMITMCILQGLNLLALLFIFRWVSHNKMPIVLPFRAFRDNGFNVALTLVLTFFIPFGIINYLLIFYNNKYTKLTGIYPDSKGRLYMWYAAISIGIIVVPMVLKVIF